MGNDVHCSWSCDAAHPVSALNVL